MYQVDSEDANFLFLEQTDSPTHMSLIALYNQSELAEKVVRFQHIMQLIGARMKTTPVFHQKIKSVPANLDYPYWIDDEQFDLDYHVRHLALPKPGDWRQFCIQVSRLHSRPLDISRPLWELYVIEGLDRFQGLPPGSFALYFKIHHCVMDEFTAIELLESLHQTVANPEQHQDVLQPIAHLPARAPGVGQMLAQAAVNNSLRSLRLLQQSLVNYRQVSRLAGRLSVRVLSSLFAGETLSGVPATRFGGKLTTARVFYGAMYQRQQFDQLAARVPGATLAQVLMLVCGEALRLYIERVDQLRDVPLSALLQVDVRNAGAHALLGNRIAIEQIDLFSSIHDLTERLHAMVGSHGEYDDEHKLEQRGFKLRAMYENVPAPLLALLGRNSNRGGSLARQLMHGGNFGFAELAGSDVPLYLLGARLHAFTTISPLFSGCGLMFSACTYGESVSLSFTSDRDMLPDPKTLHECIDEVVELITEEVHSRSRKRTASADLKSVFSRADTRSCGRC